MGSNGWKKVDRRYLHTHIRPQVIRRNLAEHNGVCELAIPDVCTVKPTQVHHMLGVSTATYDPTYMQYVCAPCNRAVGNPLDGADPVSSPAEYW